MPPEPLFTDLVHRLREGDPESAEWIFDHYVHRLVGLASGHLPPFLSAKVDAEDVVQSVFRSFFTRQREGQFLLEDSDRLWHLLALLTVRKCGQHVDHYLAARRDVRREAGPGRKSTGAVNDAASPTPSPLEAVLLAETVAALLQGLDANSRRIVQLRLEGYTIEEISDRMPCTERTVYRILEKVRATLEPPTRESAAS